MSNCNSMSTFERIPFGFAIIDKNFVIQQISPNFVYVLQSKEKDLIKKNIELFLPEIKTFDLIKSDELKKITTIFGQNLYFKMKKIENIKKNLYILFYFDFSNYEQLLKQINSLNEQIYLNREMLNRLQDGVFITDNKGETLFINDTFINLSGLRREDVIGKTVYQLMNKGIVPNSCCAKVLESGQPTSTINNYYGGKSCLVSGDPIYDSNHEIKRVVSIIRDVSELVSLREKLAKETTLSLSYKCQLKKFKNNIDYKNNIITISKKMEQVYKKAVKVTDTDSSILILGETGVGKDFLANFIHNVSKRSKEGCFIKINCGAIPGHLLESELFGYEPGAFTGAQKQGKAGLFELSNNGTLYLDEIGDMPYNLQVKLLNALQDRKFYRLGGTKMINFNPRIIAATNADLEQLVKEKKFRIDLFYRLNVINIKIPPLRHRKEDIIPIAMEFLKQFNKKYQHARYFSSRTLELFLIYDWPGNIREMKNLIERLVIISDKDCIEPELFQDQIIDNLRDPYPFNIQSLYATNSNGELSLKQKLAIYEASIIKETINSSKTLKEAAKTLGIDLSTLVRKKQKYKL